MKNSTARFWLQVLPALLLLGFSVVAQQRQATPEPELALKVDRGVGRPMELRAFNGGGGEAAQFRRLESWKPSGKEAPVDSIVFKIEREGDVVITHLSVRLENDKEVKVGTYRLSETESIKIEELTKVGLEPIVLTVVKAKPPVPESVPPIMPKVENKTKAIEIVGFHPAPPPFPDGFQLTLRNVSAKTIIALDLFMPSADGNGGGGQRLLGDKAHPVMLPGGTCVNSIGVSSGGRMTPDGYVPDVVVQRTLIIRTVVFDDGNYDGEVEPAAEFASLRRGLDI